jgi:heptosyltransferase-2
MDKIVFFHMNQLGDLMFSLPLLAAAKKAWPQTVRCSVVRADLAPLLEAGGLVDRVIVRPRGSTVKTLRFIGALREERFSIAVMFSESPETLLCSTAAGIPRRYGFKTASLGVLLTHTADRTGVPSLKNNRALGGVIGLTDIPEDYTGLVTIPQKEQQEAAQWLASKKIESFRMAVIAPGSSRRRTEKCWDALRWKELLHRLADNGIVPVLTGSPKESVTLRSLAYGVHGAEIFSAPSGLVSLGALMARARLFVGIDSGAMHLAASLRVPVIALFGPTDPAQVAPQPPKAHRIIKRNTMSDITVEEVWKEIDAQIYRS